MRSIGTEAGANCDLGELRSDTSEERLLGSVERTALDPGSQFGVDWVEYTSGPGTHDRRRLGVGALRVLSVGLLDGLRVGLWAFWWAVSAR